MKKIWVGFALLISILFNACSSIPFIPTEGSAAKFNLATVEYVDAARNNQKDEVIKQVIAMLPSIIDSLLADERNKINLMNALLNEHQEKLTEMSTELDATNADVLRVSSKVLRDISEVKSSVRDFQMYTSNMKSELETLPLEVIQEMQTAFKVYLDQKPKTEKPSSSPSKSPQSPQEEPPKTESSKPDTSSTEATPE
tara:strand:+ start:3332 stop:3925 length:594 start_codon:yes stop_codon:yes gene_type:complete